MSAATLADAGFKTITCGTSGSGCFFFFFIANILLIALCCVVILIKQDLESRRLKRVNQGQGTASAICIPITHSSPALGKDKGPCHDDLGTESPPHRGVEGFCRNTNISLMLEDLHHCAFPSSKVSPVLFHLSGLLLFCFFAVLPWQPCLPPSLVLRPVSATSLLLWGTTKGVLLGSQRPSLQTLVKHY